MGKFNFDAFAGGLASGISAGRNRRDKQQMHKDNMNLKQQQLDLNAELGRGQLDLKGRQVSIQEKKFGLVIDEVNANKKLQEGMAMASKKGGMQGVINFLNDSGKTDMALTFQQKMAQLNTSIAKKTSIDNKNFAETQKFLGSAAQTFFNDAQGKSMAPKDLWKVYQPGIQKLWPDAPKKYSPQVDAMLRIAVGQAMPGHDSLLRKTQSGKLIGAMREAKKNGDDVAVRQMQAELMKKRIVINPESGEMVDLDNVVNPKQAGIVTKNRSVVEAKEAPKGTPIMARGNPVTQEMAGKIADDPKAVPTPGAFKTPTGFRKKDITNTKAGVEAIPGGPKDRVSMNDAGKAQMMRTAQASINDVRALFFNEDGSPNYKNIISAQAFGIPGSDSLQIKGLPWTSGRRARSLMELGIQAITRLETGAAMTKDEVESTRSRFMPSPFDDEQTVKNKMLMYEGFITGTIKLIDPNKRFMHGRYDDGLNYLRQGGTIKELIAGKLSTKKELAERKAGADPEVSDSQIPEQFRNDPKMKDYIHRFLKVNPKATVQDAIKFKLNKEQK